MEREGGGSYQDSLASTLDAIQTEEERRRIGPICMSRLVFLEPAQEERNAVLRLVVNDFGHDIVLIGELVQMSIGMVLRSRIQMLLLIGHIAGLPRGSCFCQCGEPGMAA
jgi:hypothetical protein